MTAVDLGMPALPLRQQRRSVSQLVSHSQCGEQYRLSRVARVPSRPAGWFIMGTAAHAAIEEWEKSRRKTKPADLKDLYFNVYDDAVEAEQNRVGSEPGDFRVWMTGGFKKGEDDVMDRRDLGWFQVQDYQDYALSERHLWQVVESEYEFTTEIAGVRLTGFIDQVVVDLTEGGMPRPRDLKGGASVPDHPTQLAVYRKALSEVSAVSDSADWVWLGRPEKGRSKARATNAISIDLTEWPIERLEVWLQQMDQAEKLGLYPPSPTKDCERTCPVAQFCSIKGDWPSASQYLPVVESSTSNKESA